jgi:zinc/manganese transport system substrate-binding protein
MERKSKVVWAVVAAGILVAAGAFLVLTSTAPAAPCPPAAAVAPSQVVPAVPTRAPDHPTAAGGGSSANRGSATGPRTALSDLATPSGTVLRVVAAENFWGSLVAQLGGNYTSVLSILSDPNADPHEYESSSQDATAIACAQLVIVNGVGYDDWALQLIGADDNPHQAVLNVGNLVGVNVTGGIVAGNPHLWYNPTYVNDTVAAMYSDLTALEPSATPYFQANYAALNVSLGELYGRANAIRDQFSGTEVASTESIFVYLANFTDLDLVSPPSFMEAISEGNDPPAQSVVTFEDQLESGSVSVLVYNEQTVTPITTQMEAIATAYNVTVVGITETIQPTGTPFQTWMGAEYQALEAGLSARAPAP